ncbi:MAG: hypothetical protein HKN50_07395, partial [Gammaproteobacteria bacterium]|nr:hypothetical protein [Gammaproteobacteria bacterium]
MIDLSTLTTFFGWCTVINIAFYSFTALMLLVIRGPVIKLHSSLSGVAEERLPEMYFSFLANYKLAFIMFNLIPYLA